jgi:hypothetical protein
MSVSSRTTAWRRTLAPVVTAGSLLCGCATAPYGMVGSGIVDTDVFEAAGYRVSVYYMASPGHADWYCRHQLGSPAMYGNELSACARRQIVDRQVLCEVVLPVGATPGLVVHEAMHCAIGAHHP